MLENLTKVTEKGPTRPASFNGLIWSINAIMCLYEQQKELGFPYLLTNRLNQDILENSFAGYRQRGGYNVRTFRTTFRMTAKINLMKPSNLSNCEEDEDSLLITRGAIESSNQNPPEVETSSSRSPRSEEPKSESPASFASSRSDPFTFWIPHQSFDCSKII
ncbi:unnamed protein product [Phaedon cochleariae]|uniref:Uncharacterized protein n=1 Tax=Phaedon cochleariae TaxID=80249 RepID=A0A9N9SMI9_PHACE|nr:unnamed protein product [Phaedon cochleariae]